MIHLVLDQLGERTAGFECLQYSRFVAVPDTDRGRPFQVDEQIGKRKAIVPEPEGLLALLDVSRIDKAIGNALEFQVNNALGHADLDRADASAETVRALKLVQGIAQFRNDWRGLRNTRDRAGNLAQHWGRRAEGFCAQTYVLN